MLMRRRLPLTALLMSLCVARGAMPLAPGPEDADVRVNGLRMRVHRTLVSGSPEPIARAVRERWVTQGAAAGDLAPVSKAGEWTVVGHRDGDLHEVWQLRDAGAGRSELLVSVTDLSARPRQPEPPALGLPTGARLLSTTESIDRGRPVVAQFARSRLSPPQLLEWVRAAAAARGWQEVSLVEARERQGGFVIVHRRGATHVTTTAASGPGGTRFVFNQVGEARP